MVSIKNIYPKTYVHISIVNINTWKEKHNTLNPEPFKKLIREGKYLFLHIFTKEVDK